MVTVSPAQHAHCMAFACHRTLAASDWRGVALCRLAALSTSQDPSSSMQGSATAQRQFPQGAESSYLPPAAMYGEAPSLRSESSLSQMSSVPSLQQILASGQVDERLLSTLQGLTARNPGAPGLPGSLGTAQGMGLGQAAGLGQPQLGAQQQGFGGLMASGSEGSGGSATAGSLSRQDMTSEQAASAHQLWQALAQAEAGQAIPQVCSLTQNSLESWSCDPVMSVQHLSGSNFVPKRCQRVLTALCRRQ